MIRLDGVARQFGSRVVLRDLTWTIPDRARIGLVGPNGAGKTTALRILAGLDEPDEGNVYRAGRTRIAYLPQEVETVRDGTVLSVVLDGFAEIRDLEDRLQDLEHRMATLAPDDPELDAAAARYGEARHRFEALGGDRLETRARAILSGLGVPSSAFQDPVLRLSGGWRMRVVLARLLLGEPDLLLLDEPTNHLDLQAIGWLEGFLESFEGAFVVVSHDRYFLNRMTRAIAELDRGALTTYAGNYDAYLAAVSIRDAALEKAARQQARDIARTERFIERFRYKNTKAKQVQSRIHALSRMERIETAGTAPRIRFGFPKAPRSGDIAVRAEGVGKAYGDTVVYRDLDLLLRRGDRVALVGPNGAGKTTLLKLLAGVLEPDHGDLEIGHNVRSQYYAQHQLDALDPSRTVLQEVEFGAPPGMTQRLRNLLGAFLFRKDDVDKKVAVLSGGEKARLALAKLLIHPSNLLLLDEPTNHLDLRSREILEEALNEYEGTLVLISHDRYFINRVVDHVAEVGDGKAVMYPGDYDTFLERRTGVERDSAATAADPAPRSGPEPAVAAPERRSREHRRVEAERRNRLYRARKAIQDRLSPVETEIAELEDRVRSLVVMQAEPETYGDPASARAVALERAEAERRLEELYGIWESLAADLPE